MTDYPHYTFRIEGIHPVSTNDMYFHMPKKTKSGRMTTYAIRTPELKKFQSDMAEYLPKVYPKEVVDEFNKYVIKNGSHGLQYTIVIFMPKENYWKSDTTNYIKALEDTLVSYSGIDDSAHMIITQAKGLSPTDSWSMLIDVGVCDRIPKL